LGFPLYLDAWSQYTPAIVKPPQGADVVDDWYVFWSLAKRLRLPLDYAGVPLDMNKPPTSEDLLRRSMGSAMISLDELKACPDGIWCGPQAAEVVQPARPGANGRFTVAPEDVRREVSSVLDETTRRPGFAFRLAVRRSRDLNGSIGHQTPSVRDRNPYNPLYLNPQDMERLHIKTGDWVEITSEAGSTVAIAAADAALRTGVVSMSHNWGDLSNNDPQQYRRHGASTNFLIHDAAVYESINAMPRMSAIPVNVAPWTGPGSPSLV
jgi:anaerobic selenocysteine-containing dehydrogenase